ncbi:dickkopf WNT signaling pathway inhibitor 1a [Trichomycterus rosablanca]|uniref:dickkopf WNT signaling pathway inhibitor 1a n=1 Tax=Trichomycterus rosablanca TaxID=2290929 RepID=UPI002F353550
MKALGWSVIVAVYLSVFIGSAVPGSASRNAIKNLQTEGVRVAEAVSASPHAATANQTAGTRSAAPSCVGVICGQTEFCSRGICQRCRNRRKRCGRGAMCCPGNRCINGVCQAGEANTTQTVSITDGTQQVGKVDGITLTGTHNRNGTVKLQQGKRTSVSPRQQEILKGGEIKDCVRSSDCGPGMCCARHFWSKICKPVLTEGQVCTHRRKNTQAVEIFQRCDCSQGLVCRVQKERATGAESQQQLLLQQQQPGKNNTNKAARKLHTCQSG